MSIIIRKNKHTARIMRQQYVRKGSEDNDHGFVRQVPLATISLSATQVPPKISEILSTKELEHLQRLVIQPAIQHAERLRKAAEVRERDPVWRLHEAIKWLEEAAQRSEHAAIPDALRQRLDTASAGFLPSPVNQHCRADPIDEAIKFVKQATAAVEQGYYGRNTEEPVRKDTPAAKRWADLRAVLLDETDSLQAALQETGWVVKRNRSK